MTDVELVVYAVVSVFTLQAVCHLLLNPHSMVREPTAKRADEMVESRGSRAMGIFAVVLVVVNFILSHESDFGINQSLALVTTLLSAGFLMLAFTLEVYGGLNAFLFKLQEDSLTYAGLLLFSGLYFVVVSVSVPSVLQVGILVYLVLAWGIWLFYKADYLFVIQRGEWREIDASRREYLLDVLRNRGL